MRYMNPHVVEWLNDALNVNVTVLINFGIALFAVVAALRSTWASLYAYAESICLTTVYVKEEDPLYHDILLWMDEHVFQHRNFRSVTAVTSKQLENKNAMNTRIAADSHGKHGLSDTTSSIQLKPFQGSRLFRFNGKWILFSHSASRTSSVSKILLESDEDKVPLKLQCFSFSLNTQHHFLYEAAAYRRKVSMSNVTVHRALTTPRGDFRWRRITSRPRRDLSTVILDQRKKQALLNDIEEFLHLRIKQWYANHGIPYRRGYLFSGPPGTGKTSLASAIAGAFGLDVYVLSLMDSGMTESHFMRLFSEVPEQCVVLLEDIDAAGVTTARDIDTLPAEKQNTNGLSKDGEESQRLTRRREDITTTRLVTSPNSASSQISLSGLLNAIDGISSHEGRILIMTTNAPQALDRALIRPGRVDLHIQFELPSREELRALFLSMYSDLDIEEEGYLLGVDEKSKGGAPLDELAEDFADKLPERQFSLAEVQGFLLQHKKKPAEACSQVLEWLAERVDEDEGATS
ncbi:BCS1 and AAA domain-containing protein [Aspergillus puulaauensis]|uniref:P-loop containing nucleoside triphosphate hydrolase protein n=1 Tax=Aspergillus puulaauensis TaxID=1220207 RepID=A0A7R7XEV1_9EURO|nr:uncharacterized protein APUU_20491S [Aspergillus puulaauensis]BCS20059.1 hypothetical protein APUU_20491S [Aspergillus puulaauensis]